MIQKFIAKCVLAEYEGSHQDNVNASSFSNNHLDHRYGFGVRNDSHALYYDMCGHEGGAAHESR